MCGISGVYGPNALRLSLLITLGQLQRGTLGTGLAWVQNRRLKILKKPIHPLRFVRKYYHTLPSRVMTAIAHNRQPSMGDVSFNNTHPFVECRRRYALIHNGSCIFDRSLIGKMKQKHRILGKTDSEIVCHLLEQLYDEHGDMTAAIERLLETSFNGAILIVTVHGEVYGTRKGWAPLHYAKHNEHVFLASEAEAIKSIVGDDVRVFQLKPRQIIEVCQGNVEIHGEGEEEPQVRYYHGLRSPYYSCLLDLDSDLAGYQEL